VASARLQGRGAWEFSIAGHSVTWHDIRPKRTPHQNKRVTNLGRDDRGGSITAVWNSKGISAQPHNRARGDTLKTTASACHGVVRKR
jgi:hypothetical protein